MATTLFLAEGHSGVRHRLRTLLEAQPDFTVIGEANNAPDTLHQVELACPHIVIVDITITGLNGLTSSDGIEVTRRLGLKCPASRVILLSLHATEEHQIRAFQAGASGFLLKESVGKEIIQAIRAIQAGQRFVSKAMRLPKTFAESE